MNAADSPSTQAKERHLLIEAGKKRLREFRQKATSEDDPPHDTDGPSDVNAAPQAGSDGASSSRWLAPEEDPADAAEAQRLRELVAELLAELEYERQRAATLARENELLLQRCAELAEGGPAAAGPSNSKDQTLEEEVQRLSDRLRAASAAEAAYKERIERLQKDKDALSRQLEFGAQQTSSALSKWEWMKKGAETVGVATAQRGCSDSTVRVQR